MTRLKLPPISWLAAVMVLLWLHAARGQALVEAGVPALSREWSVADYQQAATVLASGKVPLPTLADPEGRAFLKRLTSTDNLSFARNKTLPVAARLEDFGKMMIAPNQILKQYLAAANKGAQLHAEIALQMSFVLHIAEEGVLLAEEFIPTIPKDNKYKIRLDGLKKMNSGLTSIFVGAESSLGENTFYSQEDLSLLLQAMADTLPTVKRAFPPDYKIEFRKKLEARLPSFPAEQDTANLKKMIAEIGR
jgi:hypothetical protein